MRIVKEVRSLRRGNEDSAHPGPLAHGHYPVDHREYGGLPRSFGELMLVVFPRSFSHPQKVWYNTPRLPLYPLEMLITLGVMWSCSLVLPR